MNFDPGNAQQELRERRRRTEESPEEWLEGIQARRRLRDNAQQRIAREEMDRRHDKIEEQWKNRWRFNVTVLICCAAVMLSWYATPISDIVADVWLAYGVDIEKDLELGQSLLSTRYFKTIEDATWSQMIQDAGENLVQGNPKLKDYPWGVYIVPSSSVNAHCYPNGSIFITSGLMRKIKPTSGELAALLAHEMSHVTYRHTQRRIQKLRVTNFFLHALGIIFAGMLPLGSPRIGERFWDDLERAIGLGEAGFSRRDENQADAGAWDLLADDQNAFSPYSLCTLFEKLQLYERSQRGWATNKSWSSTHPDTADRLKNLKAKWNQLSEQDRSHFEKASSHVFGGTLGGLDSSPE